MGVGSDPDERSRILAGTELFGALGDDALALLGAVAVERSYPAGSVVVREGDLGDGVYVVVRGEVQVYLERAGGDDVVLARLGPGELFGEQYLLTEGGRRNAAVGCRSAADLLHLAADDYRALVARHPEIERRVRVLGERHDDAATARRGELARMLRVGDSSIGARGRCFLAGDTVFREGDAARGFYIILRGEASVYAEARPDVTLRTLGPGDGFGELALLNDAPRSASVRAETTLLVQFIPREQFLRLHEQSAEVRERMAALAFAYRMPSRGVVLQWVGRDRGQASIERTYRLEDGRTWSSTFQFDAGVFWLEATAGGQPAAVEHVFTDTARGVSRTVVLDAVGRITALFGVGPWGRLPTLIEAALDGTPIAADRLASFAMTGAVHFDPPPRAAASGEAGADRLVCFCMQVRRGRVHEEIRAGCSTFEDLRAKTGCGSVCGGCEPGVKELLGHSQWTPAAATSVAVRDDLRCFRLYPRGGAHAAFIPGQHVVVEGFLGGSWVARPYTIISAPQEARYLEIAVKREPLGLFSRWLFAGDLDDKALHVSAPRGHVRWEPGDRPTACFVAGIGVTPALAIVRAAAAAPSRRVHVDYSARTAADLAFREEIEAAVAATAGVTYKTRATGAEGRLTADEVRAVAAELGDADFHLCGPAPFMDFVREALLGAGVAAGRIKVEHFIHAGPSRASVVVQPPIDAPAARARASEPAPHTRRWRYVAAVGACLFAALVGVYYAAAHLAGP